MPFAVSERVSYLMLRHSIEESAAPRIQQGHFLRVVARISRDEGPALRQRGCGDETVEHGEAAAVAFMRGAKAPRLPHHGFRGAKRRAPAHRSMRDNQSSIFLRRLPVGSNLMPMAIGWPRRCRATLRAALGAGYLRYRSGSRILTGEGGVEGGFRAFMQMHLCTDPSLVSPAHGAGNFGWEKFAA